jgi:hypothetical protein
VCTSRASASKFQYIDERSTVICIAVFRKQAYDLAAMDETRPETSTPPETIDHATLVRLLAAGAVEELRAVGQPGGWVIALSYGRSRAVLNAQRARRPRLFRRLETLVAYLATLGVANFEIDASGFVAEPVPTRRRPDRAAALRQLHRGAVRSAPPRTDSTAALALREADDPRTEWIAHKEVKREWAALRAALLETGSGA